jgi:hypothetical protein
MPRPRRTEQEIRDLIVRQGELTALADHPSWPVLEAVVAEEKKRTEKTLLAVTLYKEGTINEADIHAARGYLRGLEYVLAVPRGAKTKLERELREGGVRVGNSH